MFKIINGLLARLYTLLDPQEAPANNSSNNNQEQEQQKRLQAPANMDLQRFVVDQ